MKLSVVLYPIPHLRKPGDLLEIVFKREVRQYMASRPHADSSNITRPDR